MTKIKKEFFDDSLEEVLCKASSALSIPKEELHYQVVEQELGRASKKKVAIIVEFDEKHNQQHKKQGKKEDAHDVADTPADPPQYASYLVDGIFKRMMIDTQTTCKISKDQYILSVEMKNQSLDLKKGRGRELRGAIQHLVNRAMARFGAEQGRFIVDIGGKLEDRCQDMGELTHAIENSVIRMKKSLHIHMMDSQDRRILHMGLSESDKISTKGSGKKQFRILTVEPAVDHGSDQKQ